MSDVAWIDFHFDIMCPWAYQTSLWIREVRELTGLEVRWRFFSLEEANREDGKKHPWERDWSYGWSMMRIGATLRRRDMALLDDWYATAGRALHLEGRKPHDPDVARQLLSEMGLESSIVDEALADPTTHDEILTEHQRVTSAGGFGVPTIAFPDGRILFGPVIVEPPTGADAVALWEHMVSWQDFDGLYEIQRPKAPSDIARIAEKFTPYLTARDWRTIQKETP